MTQQPSLATIKYKNTAMAQHWANIRCCYNKSYLYNFCYTTDEGIDTWYMLQQLSRKIPITWLWR